MTIQCSHNPQDNILTFKVTGYLTLNDYFEATESILNSSEYPLDIGAIWDIREMEFDNLDIDFQKQIVGWHEQRDNPRRNASIALVSNYPLGEPILKLFQNLASQSYQNINIFRTLEDAVAWIKQQ